MEIELRHGDLSSGMHYAPITWVHICMTGQYAIGWHGRHIWVHIWVGQYAMGWHGREVRGSAARTPATALPFCP